MQIYKIIFKKKFSGFFIMLRSESKFSRIVIGRNDKCFDYKTKRAFQI